VTSAPIASPNAPPTAGAVVLVRTRAYLVEAVQPAEVPGAGTRVTMACLEDDAQGEPLEVIWELELDARVLDREAWKRIGERGFDDSRLFAAYFNTLRWNCVTATDPRLLQAPFRAGIKLDAYQLEPLRKALELPRVNLLIADDVGLGKTIEAGLVARELLLRKRVREIVVACPPSMITQWREELDQRFGLTFEVFDKAYVRRVREQHGWGVNPWTTFPRFLISHRLLIDDFYVEPLRVWMESLRPGTLFIFDEAHHAAPSSGSKYAIDSRITNAIRNIAPRFEHRLFLSATPHNGHSNSFSALLEILDDKRFVRGTKVRKGDLDAVMVRRLKEDIREIEGGFPKRTVEPIEISGLPADAPELRLAELLEQYARARERRFATASRSERARGMLIVCNLQHRLLSSVDAFARTLSVHRRSMEARVWSNSPKYPHIADLQRQLDAPGADDELGAVSEQELDSSYEHAAEAATESYVGEASPDVIHSERSLLDEMTRIADAARGLPDARIVKLLTWIQAHQCAGVGLQVRAATDPRAAWTDRRLLIFTEWDDTRRWLHLLLERAIANSASPAGRLASFHGATPDKDRDAIKRAFNAPPDQSPLRILIATDAAREGLNLQAQCYDLVHFDLPWNPARLEQRNGRIDRKLQPSPEVFCRYFVYTQRPEDRVLRVLVRKTDKIRAELGSLNPVISERIAKSMQGGIRRDRIAELEREIDGTNPDADASAAIEEELESSRERQDKLRDRIGALNNQLETSRRQIGFDEAQFRDALSCALELLKAPPLQSTQRADGRVEFTFPALDREYGADSTWSRTLDTLRAPPKDGEYGPRWRKEARIRPVVFDPPAGFDDSIVQLHLEHRIAQRLLGRFRAQGFVHHDLSRACLGHTHDGIARVILLGRLALFGDNAARLHEELITVSARWVDPGSRKAPLQPYARDAEAKTLAMLQDALRPGSRLALEEPEKNTLAVSIARDIEELLPHLQTRGGEARADAEAKLSERGQREARMVQKLLEDQRTRVQKQLAERTDNQLELAFDKPEERRQAKRDRDHWERWLRDVAKDLTEEPARVARFYQVRTTRLEPVGIAYLWPLRS
jgi:hypothetical protein